uniref:C2H2-type domain-containing protein n=1 Tax=Sinocyclocheilus grahami TaxID=75366 RepID=A0A672QEW0_SINGR
QVCTGSTQQGSNNRRNCSSHRLRTLTQGNGEKRKSYVCKYCGKAFTGLSNVVTHQRVHTGERPFKCDTCGKLFTEAGNLKKHQRKVHTGERPYSCSQCGQTFAGNLKKHQRVHTGEKPFVCPRCGKRFAWICNLKTHQQSACCGGV